MGGFSCPMSYRLHSESAWIVRIQFSAMATKQKCFIHFSHYYSLVALEPTRARCVLSRTRARAADLALKPTRARCVLSRTLARAVFFLGNFQKRRRGCCVKKSFYFDSARAHLCRACRSRPGKPTREKSKSKKKKNGKRICGKDARTDTTNVRLRDLSPPALLFLHRFCFYIFIIMATVRKQRV